MEKTLNLILDKLDAMDRRLDKMDQRLDSMDLRLTAELNRQGDLIHQLINTVAATNVKLTETNEKLAALETKVDTVIDEVKEIKNSGGNKT